MSRTQLDSTLSLIWKKNGAFFAFSELQFKEEVIKNTRYTRCSGGLFCPSVNVEKMYEELDAAVNQYHKEDLETSGKQKIIWRELANHEAQISMDITSTVAALAGYTITGDEVKAEWKAYLKHCVDNNWF